VAARVIEPAAQEATKAVAAQYTAEELVTKRIDVSFKFRDALEQRLKRHGVVVDTLAAVNYDFSSVFDKAIEAKVEAEQKKLTAERDLERIKVEAEQAFAKARPAPAQTAGERVRSHPEMGRKVTPGDRWCNAIRAAQAAVTAINPLAVARPIRAC
jgi:regulator of protease activity HflC (stomatin/prohibitin superfamily)